MKPKSSFTEFVSFIGQILKYFKSYRRVANASHYNREWKHLSSYGRKGLRKLIPFMMSKWFTNKLPKITNLAYNFTSDL